MVTIKQIAERAGVHPTTASGILHNTKGNSRASAETRERVLALAAELGYAPNQAARQLRRGTTNTIGLVAGDLRNPFFAELAAHLEARLEAEGYHLLLTCRVGQPEASFRNLLHRAVDGLIVWHEPQQGASTPRSFAPRALLYLGPGPDNADRIQIPIATGLELALSHLKSLGIRRPLFFAPASAARQGLPVPRADLFKKMAEQLNFPKRVSHCLDFPHWDPEQAAQQAEQIQANGLPGNTGIVAFNDVTALGWLMAARKTGCSAPVVSFDGTAWSRAWQPRIPCVEIPTREIATLATTLLLRRLKNPDAPPQTREITLRLHT